MTGTDTTQPPRQAAPPSADAMQSLQCICTRHLPSTGGELACADTGTPPRQAELDTPPKEGNCPPPEEGNWLVQTRHNHPVRRSRRVQTRCNRPSVFVLDISPPEEGNWLVQIRGHHPVKRSLTPLRRRGIVRLHRRGIGLCRYGTPPRQAELDTPPQEGNLPPPQEGNGLALYLSRYEVTGNHLVRLRPAIGGGLLKIL